MPSSEDILEGLGAIANEWRTMAIVWHVLLGVLLLSISAGWRPSFRLLGLLMLSPFISVSALAWASGNPFNGSTFAILSVILGVLTSRLPTDSIRAGSRSLFVPGAVLVAFGWMYPHFLKAGSWMSYAYAAPLGLVPCPTLSVAVGLTLILGCLGSRAWSAALALAGISYGAIGVFALGVGIDVFLLAGALALAGATTVGRGGARDQHVPAGAENAALWPPAEPHDQSGRQ